MVKKEINQHIKKNIYPIDPEIQRKNRDLWKLLLHKGFIEKEKYLRLTRTTPFSDNELADFINRQLVETRQSSKAVIQILDRIFSDTEVVYSKARNVASFKKEYDFVKVRELNDLHHAKDAYLNIVVGNAYNVKFTKSPIHFIRSKKEYSLNDDAMFGREIKNAKCTAWIPGEDGTIQTVRKMMSKNNILFTRLSYEFTGALFDGNPMRAGKGQQPLKSDPRLQDISKYGGYNKVSGAYFALLEHEVKKKRIRTIEYIPVMIANEIRNNPEKLEEYFESKGLTDYRVIIPRIKFESLFEVNGAPMHMTGRTGDSLLFKHALQLILSDQEPYLKKIVKFIDREKENKGKLTLSDKDGITKEENIALYNEFSRKIDQTLYKIPLRAQVGNLEKFRAEFEGLPLDEQVRVLYEILHFFQCNRTLSDLSAISGSKFAGSLSESKNISNWSSARLIHQSITGLFEQVVDLKKI